MNKFYFRVISIILALIMVISSSNISTLAYDPIADEVETTRVVDGENTEKKDDFIEEKDPSKENGNPPILDEESLDKEGKKDNEGEPLPDLNEYPLTSDGKPAKDGEETPKDEETLKDEENLKDEETLKDGEETLKDGEKSGDKKIIDKDSEAETVKEQMTLESESGSGNVKVEGKLPQGSVLTVDPISDERARELIGNTDENVVCAFDIALSLDNKKIEPDGTVKVTIAPPSGLDIDSLRGKQLKLIHILDDGNKEEYDLQINSNDEFEFEARSFSPWIITINGEEKEVNYIEKADGKTFNQTIRVNFSDASLVNSASKVKLTVFGNVSKDNVKSGENVSKEMFSLVSMEFGMTNLTSNSNGSTAYADCTITGIPAYIIGGTGDVTKGGNGSYSMPSGFYGVMVETVNGYTPKQGSGEGDLIILSPVKDDNDASWSTRLVTVENDILDLVSPSFSIDWQDNRNFAGMRPYSDGSSIMEGKSSEIAGKILLFYKNGDSYMPVDSDSLVLVSAGSEKPLIYSSSFSTWNVSFSKLPKSNSQGTEYEWYIKLSDDFLDDGTDRKAYYKVSGLNSEGYLPISGAGTSKISLEFTDGVRGSIIWRADTREISIPSMPTGNTLYDTAGMKLYMKAGDDTAKEVTTPYIIKWEKTQGADQEIWNYDISGLPLYTARGDAIVYYTVIGQNPYVMNMNENDSVSYKFIYDNGEVSSETDKCYSGQKIYATVMADAEFSFTKAWYDGNDDVSIARRKTAIEKGITLYLWRYPVNKGITDGAPVTRDARQYTYKLTQADAGDVDNNTISITQDNFATGQSDTFPKYDEMGYRYIYYVTEVSNSELYKTIYHNGDEAFDGTSTDKAAENGGLICNVRSTKVAPSVTKIWKSSSVADYVGSENTFVLQKKVDGNWIDTDNEVVLKGFSSGKKKVTGVFGVQDLYDGLGRGYDLRVIEKTVVSGSKVSNWVSDEWTEENGVYSAVFELGEYTYQAVSEMNLNMTDGSESAEAVVTNKLYGTKELTLKKIWDGDWGIGTSEDKTGNVTFDIYRSDKSEVYATVTMQKATDSDSKTEGEGSLTITGSDSFVRAKNEEIYEIEGSGSKYTWTSAPIIVPAYAEDGEQYTYTIKESVTTSQSFGKEYFINVSGKKIELTARNYTASDGNKVRFDVNKIWKDEGDLFQRTDIMVEFGTYDAGGEFNPIDDENGKPYILYLKASNNYSERIWIDKDKAAEISIRESLYNEATGSYDRVMTDLNFDSDQVLTGGYIGATTGSQGNLSRPGYKVQITKGENSFAITNTRIAKRAFEFTKVWKDSENALKLRGDFLRVALFREENGSEKELAYIDIPTYKPDDNNTLTSGDALKAFFSNNGAYFPAYDENGQSYQYSVKEYICKGTYTSGEQVLADGEAETAADSKEEVKINATTETTTTGYVVDKFTEDTSYELLAADAALNRKFAELLIQDNYEYTNMAAGQRAEVPFYLVWNDPAKSDVRPDVYFTLYYKVGDEGELKPYTGEYTERWDDVESGNKYIQKAIFGGLPSADANGTVYSYYVALTLNNAASNYIVDNYTDDFGMGENGSLHDTDSLKVIPVNGTNYLKVKDGVETSQYTKENSFAVIGIKDTIKIEGRKLWLDVPEGITAKNLPNAYIYLFRESDYDDSNKVPDISGVTRLEDRKNAYFQKSVQEIASGDGSKSPQGLNEAKSMFIFGTYDASGNPVYVDFPKYDEMGFLYKYSVREIIYNKYEHELPAEIMVPSYSDNTADLTNVYKISNSRNKRNFEVTVNWEGSKKFDAENDAKATVRLYREELDTDGNYDDGNFDNVTPNTSTAVFNMGASELVDEKIIARSDGDSFKAEWLNMPIFAPSGKLYAYYAIEMTDDMPGFSVTATGDGSIKTQVKANNQEGFTGLAFGNNGIYLNNVNSENPDNKKVATFTNTYNTLAFDTITFTAEWNSAYASLIPDSTELSNETDADITKRALTFEVTATAASQAGKDNKNGLTFTEGTDFTVISVTPSSDGQGNKWDYTIRFNSPVPVYSANGNLYTYSVKEKLNSDFVKANYKEDKSVISAIASNAVSDQNDSNLTLNISNSSSNILKNSLKGNISVSKRWDDYSNDYGMREGLIRFKVDYRIGSSGTWMPYGGGDTSESQGTYQTFSLDKNGSWKTTISNLPVAAKDATDSYRAGDKYQYRIRETQIVTTESNEAEVVLDVPLPEAQNANASQSVIWKQNGTGKEDTDKFVDIVSVGNYKVYNPADITDISSAKSVKIVNQLDSDNAVTKLKVEKIWDDESDKYGLRQTSVTIMIQNSKDGNNWTDVASRVITSSSADPSDSNKWVTTFENLPKYYGSATDNDRYLYRAVEINIGKSGIADSAGTPTGPVSQNNAYRIGSYQVEHNVNTDEPTLYVTTIKNSLIKSVNSINVNRYWNDEETSHSGVAIGLYSSNFRSGTAAAGVPANTGSLAKLNFDGSSLTLTDDAPSGTFTGLPEYNSDGNPIVYYVKTTLPSSHKTQYLSAMGDWPTTGLVLVDALPHTDAGILSGNFFVTVVGTPYTSASVKKEWSDNDNIFGTRPGSVNVKLQRKEVDTAGAEYADVTWADIPENVTAAGKIKSGKGSEKAIVTLSGSWSASLSLLPAYKRTYSSNATKYEYRFVECDASGEESEPVGYSSTLLTDADNKTTITNTLITKDITVVKVWDDDSNRRGKRPSAITLSVSGQGRFADRAVTLSESGLATGTSADFDVRAAVSADGNTWTYTFAGLPKYVYGSGADSLADMAYSVTEDIDATYNNGLILKNYYTTNYAADGDATTITNSAVDSFVSLRVEKNWEDDDDKYGLRPEKITVSIQRSSDNGQTWSDFDTQDIDNSYVAAGDGNKWSKVFNNLPKYDGNVEDNLIFRYRAIEVKVGDDAVIADDTQETTIYRGGDYIAEYDHNYTNAALFVTTITNELDYDPSRDLGIINTTEPVQDEEGNDIRGGEVKTYTGSKSVNSEEDIDEADYVDDSTEFIQDAMSVEFRPDEEKGYTYSDSLTINWWNDGDKLADDPHRQSISGYLYTDEESGKKYPYVGKLKLINGEIAYEPIDSDSDSDGQRTIDAEYIEAFKAAWSPLFENVDSSFNVITILQGSVVITLASEASKMPLRTLVEVQFVPVVQPEDPVINLPPFNIPIPNPQGNTNLPSFGNGNTPTPGNNVPGSFPVPGNGNTPTPGTGNTTTPETGNITTPTTGSGSTPTSGNTTPGSDNGSASTPSPENDNNNSTSQESIDTSVTTPVSDSESGNTDATTQVNEAPQDDQNGSALASGNAQSNDESNAQNNDQSNDAARKGVRTGDDTPLTLLVVVLVILILAFIAVYVIYRKNKGRKDGNENEA